MKIVRRIMLALLTVLLVVLIGGSIAGVYWYRTYSHEPLIDHVPGNVEPAPTVDIHAPGMTALQLLPWAEKWGPQLHISPRALAAYGNAEQTMAQLFPQCHLNWTTLAGLAYVESNHGRYRGTEISTNGTTVKKIRGPRLDGTQETENIPDTDDGVLDGDTEYDVAMGPFQFIPETWRHFGVDANGDGRADPDNIDDAAVSAARYLCQGNRSLLDIKSWSDAIHSYNHSTQYVRQVFAAADAYARGEPPRRTLRHFFRR